MTAITLRVALAFGISAVSTYSEAVTPTSSPFTAAGGGVWTVAGDDIVPEIFRSSHSDPVIVNTGTLPGPVGTYRADFGTAGFSSVVLGQIDREVAGGTIWSDGFIVTGGNGIGSMIVSSHVEGAIFGRSEMFYALYVSSKPFTLNTILSAVGDANGVWRVELPDSVRVLFTGAVSGCNLPHAYRNCGHLPYENYQGSLNLTVTSSVPFTYGEELYVASIFGGGSFYEGNASFLNSAHFGISTPPSSTLSTISGAIYATAVPEPAVWMLFLSAGALLSRRHVTKLRFPQFSSGTEA